jgi:death-on-curing protein
VARRALGAEPEVRDHGLLESALVRPQASAFGEDAYPDIHQKAAALLHGIRLTLTNDEAYELLVDIAAGRLDDIPAMAAILGQATELR